MNTDNLKLAFWKLPIARHLLAWRVNRAVAQAEDRTGWAYRTNIPRIKWARRLTGMTLKASKQWADFHYGPRPIRVIH